MKLRWGDQILQSFCRTDFLQVITYPVFILRKYLKTEKRTAESCTILWNLMNDVQSGPSKLWKLKYSSGGGVNNSVILQNWSLQEISSSLFNCVNFEKLRKPLWIIYRAHWNLISDIQFRFFKFLELKFRKGSKMIQRFCRIGSPRTLVSPL